MKLPRLLSISYLLIMLALVVQGVSLSGCTANCTTPDVIGLDEARAIQEIGNQQLNAVKRSGQCSASIQQGMVVQQNPSPGAPVSCGKDVEIALSLGNCPPTAVPVTTPIPASPPPTSTALLPTDIPTTIPLSPAPEEKTLAALKQQGTSLVLETYNDNHNRWDLGPKEGGVAQVDIRDGVMVMTINDRNRYWWETWSRPVESYIAEVDIYPQTVGSYGGLVFGYKDKQNHYFIRVADGYYGIDKIQEGQWSSLVKLTMHDAIRRENNRLSVVRQGSTITVFINDTLITSIADNTFPLGFVGVAAGTFDIDQSSIQLDNFALWELP